MKSFNQDMVVHCDNFLTSKYKTEEEEINCHKEIQIIFPLGFGKRDFYQAVRADGWYISKKRDLCPYCKKRIKRGMT